MSAPLVILDTETTSLRRDRRAWDIGMIRLDHTGMRELGIYVTDVDLSNADPMSLNIGRFYQRHLVYRARPGSGDGNDAMPEAEASKLVEQWTRGAHIVGAVPNFDTEVLGDMLYRHKLCPAWHYHLQDVETLAAGYLLGRGEAPALPWKSEDLSRAVGVDPDGFDRHTALGDCRWVLAQLRAVAPALVTAAVQVEPNPGEAVADV